MSTYMRAYPTWIEYFLKVDEPAAFPEMSIFLLPQIGWRGIHNCENTFKTRIFVPTRKGIYPAVCMFEATSLFYRVVYLLSAAGLPLEIMSQVLESQARLRGQFSLCLTGAKAKLFCSIVFLQTPEITQTSVKMNFVKNWIFFADMTPEMRL